MGLCSGVLIWGEPYVVGHREIAGDFSLLTLVWAHRPVFNLHFGSFTSPEQLDTQNAAVSAFNDVAGAFGSAETKICCLQASNFKSEYLKWVPNSFISVSFSQRCSQERLFPTAWAGHGVCQVLPVSHWGQMCPNGRCSPRRGAFLRARDERSK